MDEPRRWIIGLIAVAALLALLLLARGEPDGGRGDPAAASAGPVVGLRA
jgi:hypothetical protein